MTAPRQVLEGTTYLVTRRTSERRCFLRPSKEINAIFGYLLASISERYGVLVHAVCVLSNQSDWTDVRRLPGAAGCDSRATWSLAWAWSLTI
jgi:hypothetical protein